MEDCVDYVALEKPETRSTVEIMRDRLKPQGTAQVVRIDTTEKYFDYEFIKSCIDELEKIQMTSSIQTPSKLEQLAYAVLCDSAYIK